jgi:hypothetical protein
MPHMFWTKVWTILKSYGVILGAITIVSTAAVKIDRKKQHDILVDKNLKELNDTSNHYFNEISFRLQNIEQGIDNINSRLEVQGEAIEATQKSFKQYALRDKTLSAEEFYKYMENLQYDNEKKSKVTDTVEMETVMKDYVPKIVVRKIK